MQPESQDLFGIESHLSQTPGDIGTVVLLEPILARRHQDVHFFSLKRGSTVSRYQGEVQNACEQLSRLCLLHKKKAS